MPRRPLIPPFRHSYQRQILAKPGLGRLPLPGCPSATTEIAMVTIRRQRPIRKPTLTQEILVANVDSGTVYRAAHHRTAGNYANASNSNYWAQPNLCLIPSERAILFAKRLGRGRSEERYGEWQCSRGCLCSGITCYNAAVKTTGKFQRTGNCDPPMSLIMINRTLNLVYTPDVKRACQDGTLQRFQVPGSKPW